MNSELRKSRIIPVIICMVAVITLVVVILINDSKELKFCDLGYDYPSIIIKCDQYDIEIHPWLESESQTVYYYIPSFISDKDIYCNKANEIITIDGKREKSLSIKDCFGETHTIEYSGNKYAAVFLDVGEIGSVFIDTETKSLDNIHTDKEYEEKGKLLSIDDKGMLESYGEMSSMSGHGNGTWDYSEKKPYSIKMRKRGCIAGISDVKKINLLNLYYDGDKIHSKLAFDVAQVLEGEEGNCVPRCNWANVYINGEYRGLYLVAETVSETADRNRDEVEFLIEKELEERCTDNYFVLDSNSWFVVKDINQKTSIDVNGISELMQMTENSIFEGNIDAIDARSFAIQYLVEEISLNFDAYKTSSYFYKYTKSNKIYAGPLWDYDGAFGEYIHLKRELTDTRETIVNEESERRLKWIDQLLCNEEFCDYVISLYSENKDEIEALFAIKTQEYANIIEKSVLADDIRWKWSRRTVFHAGTYMNWENDVRYLQYFGLNRLSYLSELWNVTGVDEWKDRDIIHQVIIRDVDGNIIMSKMVSDGDTLDINEIVNEYGQVYFSYSTDPYYDTIPILEDCELEVLSE